MNASIFHSTCFNFIQFTKFNFFFLLVGCFIFRIVNADYLLVQKETLIISLFFRVRRAQQKYTYIKFITICAFFFQRQPRNYNALTKWCGAKVRGRKRKREIGKNPTRRWQKKIIKATT